MNKKIIKKNWHIRIKVGFIISFSILVMGSSLYADDSNSQYRLNKSFLKNFGSDIKQVIISPGNWRENDWLTFSAVLGSGILLYSVDQKIQRWFNENRTSSSEDVTRFVSDLGHGVFIGSLSLSFYLVGELTNNVGFRKTGLLCLESWLISGAFTNIVKVMIGRARPYTGKSRSVFNPFSSGSGNHSFPSGHASSAFAVAAVIADLSKSKFVDLFVYGIASTVAIARIHDGQHWASDVFIGAAIGYYVGKKIVSLNRKRSSSNFNISFELTPSTKGISLIYRF